MLSGPPLTGQSASRPPAAARAAIRSRAEKRTRTFYAGHRPRTGPWVDCLQSASERKEVASQLLDQLDGRVRMPLPSRKTAPREHSPEIRHEVIALPVLKDHIRLVVRQIDVIHITADMRLLEVVGRDDEAVAPTIILLGLPQDLFEWYNEQRVGKGVLVQ